MKTIASAFLSVLMSVVWADVEFGNLSQQFVKEETVFTAQTQKQVDFPSDVGAPIFWLDCAATNGDAVSWKIADVEGFVNAAGTSRIALTGVPVGLKARIRYRDGALYVDFSKGTLLIVR